MDRETLVQRMKNRAEVIRKLEKALQNTTRQLEEVQKNIRETEKVVEALRPQVHAFVARETASSNTSPPDTPGSPAALSAFNRDDSLVAPPTEFTEPRKPAPSIEHNGLMITITGKPTPLEMSQGWDSKTLRDAMLPEHRKLYIQHFENVNEINRLVQDWAKQNKIIEDSTERIRKAQENINKISILKKWWSPPEDLRNDLTQNENAIRVAIDQQKGIAPEIEKLYKELLDLGVQFGLPDDMARQLADVRLLAQSNNNDIVKYAAEAAQGNVGHNDLLKLIKNNRYVQRMVNRSLNAVTFFFKLPEDVDVIFPEIVQTLGSVHVAETGLLDTQVLKRGEEAVSALLSQFPAVGGLLGAVHKVKMSGDSAGTDIQTFTLGNSKAYLAAVFGILFSARFGGTCAYAKSIYQTDPFSILWHTISLLTAKLGTDLFYELFGRACQPEYLLLAIPLYQEILRWGCLGVMDGCRRNISQCVYKDTSTGNIKVDEKKLKAIQKTFKSLNDHRHQLKVGIQDANHIEYDKNGSALTLENGVVLHYLKDVDSTKTTPSEDQVLQTVTLKSFSGQIVTQDAQEFYESGGFLKIFERAVQDAQIDPFQMAPSWRQWLSAKVKTPTPYSFHWRAMLLGTSVSAIRWVWNSYNDFIGVVVEGDDFINLGSDKQFGKKQFDLSSIRNSLRQWHMHDNAQLESEGYIEGGKRYLGYRTYPPPYQNTDNIVESAEQALEAVAEAFASDKYNSVGILKYPIAFRNVLTHAEGALNDSSIIQTVNWLPEWIKGNGTSATADFIHSFSEGVGSFATSLGPNTKTVFVHQAHIEALKDYSIAMYDGGAPLPDQQLIDSLSSIGSKAGATAADVFAAAKEYLSSCGDICSEDVVNKKSNEAIRLLVPKVKQQVFEHVSSMCQKIHEEAAQFSQEKVQNLLQTCQDWMSMPGLDEFSDEVKPSKYFRFRRGQRTYRELAQQCYNVAEGYVNLLGADNTCSDIESKMRLLEQCKNENTPITFTTDRCYGSNVTASEIYTMETESISQKLMAMYDKISLAFVSFAAYIGKLKIGKQVVQLFELFKDMLQDGVKSIVSLARLAFGMLGSSVSWLPSTKESGEVDKRRDDFEKKVANTTKACKDVENILKTAGELPTPWHAQPQDEGGDIPVWRPPMLPPQTNGGSGGLLAIGTGVVADQNLLQRPMRVDYASAATNLVRVKYEVEECEEEK